MKLVGQLRCGIAAVIDVFVGIVVDSVPKPPAERRFALNYSKRRRLGRLREVLLAREARN